MFNTKKEESSIKKEKEKEIIDQLEIEDKNVEIHTMQDDINSLSGIFPKQEKPIVQQEVSTATPEMPDISGNVSKNEKYFNPFLNNNDQNQEKISDFYQKKEPAKNIFPQNDASPKNLPQDIMPQNNASQNEPIQNPIEQNIILKAKSNKMLWVAIFLVIIAGFSAGYYYYLGMNKNMQPGQITEQVAVKEETQVEEPVVEPETKLEAKYSTDKANYLSINTSDPKFEDIGKIFMQTGAEVRSLNLSSPVEFIVTDERNNPISFSIFAVLSKIKLSSDLLSNLDDDFSLYMFNDAGVIRLNLAIKVKDKEKANSLMKTEEGKLVSELSSLFFDAIVSPAKVVFKDGSYNSALIRYFNIKEDGSQSIDYSFFKEKLLIGTSKNSMWGLVDKINLAK